MSDQYIYNYKSYLFTIAYNMLGDIAEAEDLVQDTFMKWLEGDRSDVKNMKSYLSRIIINKAIDRLEHVKREREKYKGLWMPEPILTESGEYHEEYTVEYALLFLLETLNPYERAVFVLKEVFMVSYEEIAGLLEISEDNCRQLLHRSKEKVRSPKKKQEAEASRHHELMQAFLIAYHQKDYTRLQEIFREDIVMYSDGGGKMAAALKPLRGISKVLKFLEGIADLDPDARYSVQPVFLNSESGVLIFRNDVLDTVFYMTSDKDKIMEMYFLRNPEKIKVKNS